MQGVETFSYRQLVDLESQCEKALQERVRQMAEQMNAYVESLGICFHTRYKWRDNRELFYFSIVIDEIQNIRRSLTLHMDFPWMNPWHFDFHVQIGEEWLEPTGNWAFTRTTGGTWEVTCCEYDEKGQLIPSERPLPDNWIKHQLIPHVIFLLDQIHPLVRAKAEQLETQVG